MLCKEIINWFDFSYDLSPEDFVNSTLSSKVRNEIICDVLYKCKAIETWGTGLKNIYLLCNEAGIKCSYEKELEGFWFIFYRNNANNVTTNDTIKMFELEMLILSEIQKDNHVTLLALFL